MERRLEVTPDDSQRRPAIVAGSDDVEHGPARRLGVATEIRWSEPATVRGPSPSRRAQPS